MDGGEVINRHPVEISSHSVCENNSDGSWGSDQFWNQVVEAEAGCSGRKRVSRWERIDVPPQSLPACIMDLHVFLGERGRVIVRSVLRVWQLRVWRVVVWRVHRLRLRWRPADEGERYRFTATRLFYMRPPPSRDMEWHIHVC